MSTIANIPKANLTLDRTTYKPGEPIVGLLTYQFSFQTKIEKAEIELTCLERASWPERIYNRRFLFTRQIELEHRILQKKEPIIEKPISVEADTPHSHSFAIKLPPNIPSSFSSNFGDITYTILARVTSEAIELLHEVEFQVDSPIDLNFLTEVTQLPVNCLKVHAFGICPCLLCQKPNGIEIQLRISTQTFLVGSDIELEVVVSNRSRRRVKWVGVKLQEKTFFGYHSLEIARILTRDVIFSREKGLEGGKDKVYEFKLHVPEDLVLDNFVLCKHIKREHVLCAVCSFCSTQVEAEVEVYLGHVPWDKSRKHPACGRANCAD